MLNHYSSTRMKKYSPASPSILESLGMLATPRLLLSVALLGIAVSLQLACLNVFAMDSQSTQPSDASMRQHYVNAEHFQRENNLQQAASEYRLFLSDALRILASYHAHIGEYKQAVPLYENALKVDPKDTSLLLDYAEAALAARDTQKAKQITQGIIDSYAKDSNSPEAAEAHSVLGRTLWVQGVGVQGTQQLQDAFDMDPSFTNGRAVATAYLALADEKGAANIFAKLQRIYGDTAENHINFGRVYGAGNYPDDAIAEFKKAIAMNDRLPREHYLLGVSCLVKSGDINNFKFAESQFRKELSINPTDGRSYFFLGYIAHFQHEIKEAMDDFSRSTELDPENPDSFLALGKMYADLGKTAQAKIALQHAIDVTTDVSRRHYQIKNAYFQLGHLQMLDGDVVDGKHNIQIAEKLLIENKSLDKDNLSGNSSFQASDSTADTAAKVDKKTREELKEYENQLSSPIADGYNNLGVISAKSREYADAMEYFQQAQKWSPAMEGLDANIGRAAFAAHQYAQAIAPLSRDLLTQPDNAKERSILGMSQYFVKDFSGVLSTLQPIESQIDTVPLLAYMYAESMVQTNHFNDGVARLKTLFLADPANATLLQEQAATYVTDANYDEAYELALCMVALDHKAEALSLLTKLKLAGSKNANVYYELGSLQLDNKDVASAVLNLKTAEKMDVKNTDVHLELANAYQQESMKEDAKREEEQYQAMRNNHESLKTGSKVN